jgi:phenylacetate-CoA ligase
MPTKPPFAHLYRLLWAGDIRRLEAARLMPPSEVAARQTENLSSLLIDAGRTIPYYGQRLREYGVLSDRDHVDLDRFSLLPPLSKLDLRYATRSLRSEVRRRGERWNSSGGSTGEPSRFLQDAEHRNASRAAKVVFDSWSGYALGMPRVVLWGSHRDGRAGRYWWRPALRRLKGEVWLDAYHMSAGDLDRYEAIIRSIRPVNILGYAESLHELARHLLARQRTLPPCAGVVSTAGTLFPDAREDIERAFGSPIFNRYGSRETGEMAAECAGHCGLHVSPLTHYIEVIRPDGSPCEVGEPGEILVTPLANRSMPLIRYRIGDEASLAGPCPCGCTWPRLSTVHGRTTDHVVSPRQGKVYGGAFRFILNELEWVQHYQVVQKTEARLQISLAPLQRAGAEAQMASAAPRLRAQIAELMGPGCSVEILLVDDIPPSASGKRRHVISDIATGRVMDGDPSG